MISTDEPIGTTECGWDRFFIYTEDGHMVWKNRPRSDFKNDRAWRAFSSNYSGNIAGSLSVLGYIEARVCVNGSSLLLKAHRIIWEMHHGPIPDGMFIDHINGIRHDNRIENLRLANTIQNAHNAKIRSDNSSGYKGVGINKGRWVARIRVAGKSINLGSFDDPQCAAIAYDIAASIFHGEFAKTNF